MVDLQQRLLGKYEAVVEGRHRIGDTVDHAPFVSFVVDRRIFDNQSHGRQTRQTVGKRRTLGNLCRCQNVRELSDAFGQRRQYQIDIVEL